MKELKVRITFTEEVLGSQCADKEIHRTYIASKAPDAPSREDEVATLGVDAVEEKSMTIFHKYEDGKPFVYDYQVKGMFKDSCGMLRKVKGSESSKIKAYKKEIDGLIFKSGFPMISFLIISSSLSASSSAGMQTLIME